MGTLLQIALARIIHELVLRDCENERANSTSQGELVLPVPSLSRGAESKEHPRTHGRTFISSVGVTPRRDELFGLDLEV